MTSTLAGAAGIRAIVAVRSAPRHRLNTTTARRRPARNCSVHFSGSSISTHGPPIT